MPKFRIEVSSFSTRFVQRKLTVTAKDEDEARKKAVDLFCKKENDTGSVDPGEPQVEEIFDLG